MSEKKNLENKEGYYILSLKHSHKEDFYIPFWGPDNAGYYLNIEAAGIYSEEDIQNNFQTDDGTLPISVKLANDLTITRNCNGKIVKNIPNCKAVWEILEVKMNIKYNNLERR
jgi:hypothetical protein